MTNKFLMSEIFEEKFGSVLRPFLYKDLLFATLYLSEREANLTERLPILAIIIIIIIIIINNFFCIGNHIKIFYKIFILQ